MCYNLATKCVICLEFIESKTMNCHYPDVNLNIEGIEVRGCSATDTVDGFPLFDQYQARFPIVTCPNGGRLRLHALYVMDALCYQCKMKNPNYENPKHGDFVGDRCGSVYHVDVERNVCERAGSYELLPAKYLDYCKDDKTKYFVFFTPLQLKQWNASRRKRIVAGQECIMEEKFPYAATTVDKAYCAGTTRAQHVISEREVCPLTKLESRAASWSPQSWSTQSQSASSGSAVELPGQAAEQNLTLPYEGYPVVGHGSFDTNAAYGVQGAAMYMGGGNLAAPAMSDGVNDAYAFQAPTMPMGGGTVAAPASFNGANDAYTFQAPTMPVPMGDETVAAPATLTSGNYTSLADWWPVDGPIYVPNANGLFANASRPQSSGEGSNDGDWLWMTNLGADDGALGDQTLV